MRPTRVSRESGRRASARRPRATRAARAGRSGPRRWPRPRRRRRAPPTAPRAARAPSPGVGHVHAGERLEVLQLSTPSAHTGAGRRGERDERLEQGEAVRVVVDAVHEPAVELQDVGRDADDLLQAGVAVAGVVERDRAPRARRASIARSSAMSAGDSSCSVTSMTIPSGPRRTARTSCAMQRARGDVEREQRALGRRGGQRGAQGGRLERGPSPTRSPGRTTGRAAGTALGHRASAS